jgi:hypothetical protein
MTNRPTPQQFLSDLCRDFVKHDGERPTFIAGYAKHMEAREAEIRQEALKEAFELIYPHRYMLVDHANKTSVYVVKANLVKEVLFVDASHPQQ